MTFPTTTPTAPVTIEAEAELSSASETPEIEVDEI